jgi:hypothetical protein
MKNTKLTPAQTQALQAKADRKAEALLRAADPTLRADNKRIDAMYALPVKVQLKKAPKATKKVRWSGAEFDLAIQVYLTYTVGITTAVNNAEAVREVQKTYPNRNYGSVNMLFTQIRSLDVYAPQEGFDDTSSTLISKLFAIDPVRFPAGASKETKVIHALDDLLAEIRG